MKTIVFILLTGFSIFSFSVISADRNGQQNSLPVVKIVSPANQSSVNRNAAVPYNIRVTDKEDGDTKFDEINVKEVLLQVTYLTDTSNLSSLIRKSEAADEPGLLGMRTSNCFNCHNFSGKAIGPGFDEIRKKYTPTPQHISDIAKRIVAGSTGVWGKESMPTHPDISQQQAKEMVEWILKKQNQTEYFAGTKGIIRTGNDEKINYLLLTASYVDHGIGKKTDRKKGIQTSLIKIK